MIVAIFMGGLIPLIFFLRITGRKLVEELDHVFANIADPWVTSSSSQGSRTSVPAKYHPKHINIVMANRSICAVMPIALILTLRQKRHGLSRLKKSNRADNRQSQAVIGILGLTDGGNAVKKQGFRGIEVGMWGKPGRYWSCHHPLGSLNVAYGLEQNLAVGYGFHTWISLTGCRSL